MNPNTFQDGFPRDPLQAIEYSYFFSEEEKQDWRNWLQTAPADQRDELVDILHNMWTEQQKQAVPAGFDNSNAAAPTPQSAPAPSQPTPPTPSPTLPLAEEKIQAPVPVEPPAFEPTPDPVPAQIQPRPAPAAPIQAAPAPVDQQVDNDFDKAIKELEAELARQEVPAPHIPSDNFEEDVMEENLKSFGGDHYSPNPLLDDMDGLGGDLELSQPRTTKTKAKKKSKKPSTQPSFDEDTEDMSDKQAKSPVKKTDAQSTKPQAEPKFFEVAKVRETATKKELEEIYQTFLNARTASSNNKKNLDEAHATFLDKVMRVVVNFEQVADYFESMTGKLLEMNNKIVSNAKAMSQHKISVDKKVEELERAVEDLRDDLDRLSRKHRDLESASRDRVDELREQIAMHGADTYADEGMIARFDNLTSQVKNIETNNKDLSTASKKLLEENKELRKTVSNLEGKIKDISSRPKISVADRVKQIAAEKQQQSRTGSEEKTTVGINRK